MQGLTKIRELAGRIGVKKLCAAGAVCAAGAAIALTAAFTGSKQGGDAVAADSAGESSQVQTAQTQKLPVTKFKKAPLSEYDMAQTYVMQASGEAAGGAKAPEAADFTITAKSGEFAFKDVMNSPAYFSATRDISSEYYTVRDITTGKTVTMNAFDLVCGIVYNEVGDGWGAEAIKAQAVAAYSCLRYSESIGMVETVGIKNNYTPTVQSCVRAVQGQVMFYGGSIANTLYSASTAGYSIPSGDVIVSKYPYLTCVKSAYDDQDPNWGRKVTLSKADVKKKLEGRFGIKLSDDVKNWFRITDCRYGKYIFGMSIDSKAKASGKEIAALFGLRSSAFDISFGGDAFTFTSYGWGHGVGMSQWGACMYARHGCTYDQILTHYYVGTRLGLSGVSEKAVQRGKKSAQELEQEAASASQTSAVAQEDDPQQTQGEQAQTEQVTQVTGKEPDDNQDEKDGGEGAQKVTKSAEDADQI